MPVMIIYAYAMSKIILVADASRQAENDVPVIDIQTVYRHIEYDPSSVGTLTLT
jgi:hypothetical protein